MSTITRSANIALLLFTVLTIAPAPARANLFSLAASGTISENSSRDSTIPVGTPWSFQLIYDTAAPDLDFQSTGSPDPTFGQFANTAAPPALVFFNYQAGTYSATLAHPADFGTASAIITTFTSINGIDININAPTFFPHLAGGPVSFHADFAKFGSPHIFTSDALPTNTAIGPGSFDDSNVTLLPPAGAVSGSNTLTSLTLMAVPSAPGDFNANGTVDAADYVLWRKTFGQIGAGLVADGNGNNQIDQGDFNVWRAHFGQTAGSTSTTVNATVPEPSPLALLFIGILRFSRRHLPNQFRRRYRNSDPIESQI
jgi:hypothetical protein